MKTIYKLSFLIFFNIPIFSQSIQSKIDYEHIFKNWIYIEKESSIRIDKEKIELMILKNDSIYNLFTANVELKTSDIKNNLPKEFIVKQLTLDDEHIKDRKELTPYNIGTESFSYTLQCQGAFVIIFNLNTGMSYRVKGFNGNDTLKFIQDFREYLLEHKGENFSEKKIIKVFYIEGIDLDCMLKGLRDTRILDTIKYPCLKSCLDPTIAG